MAMSDTNQQPRCLIIGAGLGGLALAQSLRKQDISFEIYERDAAHGSRAQGWALALHDWFVKYLLAATSNDMPDLETVGNTYEIGIPSEGAIFDAHDMTEHVRFGASVGTPFIRANRAKLRHWLLTDLDVHWGKRLSSYIQDANGVTAHFEDGTSARGDFLVGADGIESRVRKQLLAESNVGPQHVPMGFIVGELNATQEQYTRWMKIATSMFIGFMEDVRLFVGLRGMNADGTAGYYWLFGWHDAEATKESFWTHTASQQELHSYVLNHIEGMHQSFSEVLHATPVEGILRPPLRLRDMVAPDLPKSRVTLLGDAVHPMVPFRGEGGNMAMLDGIKLARVLASAEGEPVEDVLKEYECEMRERTTKSVLASRAVW